MERGHTVASGGPFQQWHLVVLSQFGGEAEGQNGILEGDLLPIFPLQSLSSFPFLSSSSFSVTHLSPS